MAASNDPAALRTAIAPVLERFGLVIEDLTVRSRGGRTELTLVVDLPEDRLGAADLDTVAEASTAISELLDARSDLIGDGPSVLEVTTPGVGRPLTLLHHFRRARGRLVRLPSPLVGDLREARVLAVDGDDVIVRIEPGRDERGRPRRLPKGESADQRIPLEHAAGARVQIEFDPPSDIEELLASAARDLTADHAPKEN